MTEIGKGDTFMVAGRQYEILDLNAKNVVVKQLIKKGMPLVYGTEAFKRILRQTQYKLKENN